MSDDEGNHRKIVAFLGGEFARAEGRQCVLFELVSGHAGTRGDTIRTWDRRERPELFEGLGNIENIATEILRIAEDHAETSGSGSHRFEVRTTQHLGKKQKVAFRILIEGDEDQDGGGGGDHPTATGLVGQLMRHLEVKERTLGMMVQTTVGTMSRMVADFADENRELRRDRISATNELEESRSKQAERDLMGLRQIKEDQRKDEALTKILAILPVAANRLLGKGAIPDAPSPLSILASELADSLSQEQFLKIAGALSVNQQMLLGELIRAAKETQAADAKKAEASQAPAAQAQASSATG